VETTIEGRDKLHEIALDLVRLVFPPPRHPLLGVGISNFESKAVGEAAELPFHGE
jgi:hypothetical protein